MLFEEAWYWLQIIGFRKLDKEYFIYSNGKLIFSKKHLVTDARKNIESLFSDKHVFKPPPDWKLEENRYFGFGCPAYHEPKKPYRDKSIPIDAPELCKRCSRKERLERDHIKPLHQGGLDKTDNLQYLCYKCHKFKTAEDKLINEIPHHAEGSWRREMWEYRLEAHRRLNPPEAEEYHSYGEDPKTLWDYWDKIQRETLNKEREVIKQKRLD